MKTSIVAISLFVLILGFTILGCAERVEVAQMTTEGMVCPKCQQLVFLPGEEARIAKEKTYQCPCCGKGVKEGLLVHDCPQCKTKVTTCPMCMRTRQK